MTPVPLDPRDQDYLAQPEASEADWEADKDTIIRQHFRSTMGARDAIARAASAAQLRRDV